MDTLCVPAIGNERAQASELNNRYSNSVGLTFLIVMFSDFGTEDSCLFDFLRNSIHTKPNSDLSRKY